MKFTIDQRAIKNLLKSTFTKSLIESAIREGYQNAVDSGATDIVVSIVVSGTEYQRQVKLTIEDNGRGMTERDITDKFLLIGSNNKSTDNSNIGGFGFGIKAVISQCDSFSVSTNDRYFSSDIEEDSIESLAPIVGTTIVMDMKAYPSEIYNAISLITTSKQRCKTWISLIMGDKNIAFVVKEMIITGSTVVISGWDCTASDKIVTPFGDIAGKSIYRLNGLTQYMDSCVSNIEFNHIVDIETDFKPGDTDYPLTMSRESLKSAFSSGINKWIDGNTINSLTTKMDIIESTSPDRKSRTISGYIINKNDGYSSNSMSKDDMIKLGIMQSARSYRVYLHKSFEGDYIDNHDKRILDAWMYILKVIAPDMQFGIGVVSCANAMYMNDSGITNYLINPCALKTKTNIEKAYQLWEIAIHEITHYYQQNHDERYTSQYGKCFSDNIANMIRIISKVEKILSGKTDKVHAVSSSPREATQADIDEYNRVHGF